MGFLFSSFRKRKRKQQWFLHFREEKGKFEMLFPNFEKRKRNREFIFWWTDKELTKNLGTFPKVHSFWWQTVSLTARRRRRTRRKAIVRVYPDGSDTNFCCSICQKGYQWLMIQIQLSVWKKKNMHIYENFFHHQFTTDKVTMCQGPCEVPRVTGKPCILYCIRPHLKM